MKQKDEEKRNSTAQYIAQVIKQTREAKGWTRYKLAQISGVHFGHISRIENGCFSTRLDTLCKLCTALEIELKVPLPI